jgi:hypothetical protein
VLPGDETCAHRHAIKWNNRVFVPTSNPFRSGLAERSTVHLRVEDPIRGAEKVAAVSRSVQVPSILGHDMRTRWARGTGSRRSRGEGRTAPRTCPRREGANVCTLEFGISLVCS